MKSWKIYNRTTGIELGIYRAHTEEGALDALARDAGYVSHALAVGEILGTNDDMVVEEAKKDEDNFSRGEKS